MAKVYVMTCKEIDEETGEERVVIGNDEHDGKYSGFTLLADVYGKDSAAVCCVMHDNIQNIACKLAAEPKTRMAAKLAGLMGELSSQKHSFLEDMLTDMIAGGGTDGANL